MNCLATILGGEVGALPTTYLCMPLGAKSKAVDIWDNVMEKCEKKLARWKTQYLSFGWGGGTDFINSVLDALPTYMTVFPVPARVISRLDNIRRKFLEQGNKGKKGLSFSEMESSDN
ncbi:unnamed protein product [Withania somnifera]